MTELVFQAKRLLKIEERFVHPRVRHVKFRSVAASFQCVKHEAQIIQSRSGPSRINAAHVGLWLPRGAVQGYSGGMEPRVDLTRR